MSHVATIDLEVKDWDALAEAARRIGMDLIRDQKTYRCWFNSWDQKDVEGQLKEVGMTAEDLVPPGFKGEEIGQCEHAIRVRGNASAYEIGLARRRDGRAGYVLLMEQMQASDDDAIALNNAVGASACNLKREYAFVVARKQAMAQGFTVNEQRQQDGSIRLTLRK
jgi:hypothetical protein